MALSRRKQIILSGKRIIVHVNSTFCKRYANETIVLKKKKKLYLPEQRKRADMKPSFRKDVPH